MAGIPSAIYNPLKQALLNCGPFDSDATLRAIFVDDRLRPWRDRLPQASSPSSRADSAIDFLAGCHTATGENVLVLFLRVLSERYDPADELHLRLIALVDDLSKDLDKNVSPIQQTRGQISTTQIQLLVSGELSDFTIERRNILLAVLAGVLGVEQSNIAILRVQPGSIRITIEIPQQALAKLNSLSPDEIYLLLNVGVMSIEADNLKLLDFGSKHVEYPTDASQRVSTAPHLTTAQLARPIPSSQSPQHSSRLEETEKRDFFISYNNADRGWAEWIAWQLEEAGYTTAIQAWDFRPGSNFVIDMQRAAEHARRTIAVLSPDYVQALYTQPEWAAAFARDPTGEKGTFLPVQVRECQLQGLLSQVVYIDLVGLAEEAAKETLLAGVDRGRAKPTAEPGFPGPVEHIVSEQPDFPGEASKS